MTSYIGKSFLYTVGDKQRTAMCTWVEYNESLGKNVYTGVTSYGNILRLTDSEIDEWKGDIKNSQKKQSL